MVLAAEKHTPKDCQQICTMHYDPVCASAPGETPKSFGSECVMKNYNCENNKSKDKVLINWIEELNYK